MRWSSDFRQRRAHPISNDRPHADAGGLPRRALAEIGGCFAFWSWARSGASVWWLAPGVASLCLFAWLLTLAEPAAAGRAFAAYDGIYVLTAVAWLVWLERMPATRADWLGAGLCVAGCLVILAGRR